MPAEKIPIPMPTQCRSVRGANHHVRVGIWYVAIALGEKFQRKQIKHLSLENTRKLMIIYISGFQLYLEWFLNTPNDVY